MTQLAVLMNGHLAGTLREHDRGNVYFSYTDGYDSTPLSVAAPIEKGGFDATNWIDGLLPDNLAVRQRWRSEYDAATTRPFDLLSTQIGWDCAGAVQFCPVEEIDSLARRGGSLIPLSDSQVASIIAGLRSDATAWSSSPTAAAFSLAGAQAKTALHHYAGRWYRPVGDAATTHILKPAPARFAALDLIEHLSCATASNLGLATAATRCDFIGNERTLIVTRYDRRANQAGSTVRLHQEDLCQALGVPPDLKYQRDGGPTPARIASMLRECSAQPDQDVERFRDALIYNWLIAGTDAHAKNYSLLLDAEQVRLAPLYDVCSYLPFRELTPVGKIPLSMRIGRDYTITKSDRRNAWRRTADALGLSPDETLDRVADLAECLPEAMTEAIDRLPANLRASPAVTLLADETARRSRRCARLEK